MQKIPLTQNQFAIVDDDDYLQLSQHKWFALKVRHIWYAVRKSRKQLIYMHRQILDVPKGLKTDHKNHNGLDNRRAKIRICTPAQNNQNSRCYGHNQSSKFKGVSLDKKTNKWAAYIKHNGKLLHLGRFIDEIQAAKAYDKKAKELWGDFACLNFNT